MAISRTAPENMSIMAKLARINWVIVLLLCLTASIGFALLYSAASTSAGQGSFDPWASRQMTRFAVGLVLLLVVAAVDIRFWLRNAYIIYLASLVLLVAVEFIGTGTGSQRWIDVLGIRVQPSEVLKITLVLVLARYFHKTSIEDVGRIIYVVPPLMLVGVPALLVLRQPDLGTAMMLLLVSGALFFLGGVRIWKFVSVGIAALIAIPIAWKNVLHDYQKQRILTFLEPESDPLGSGYHVLQSKIALGSGGVTGKGFLQGTQSHLNFLPEQQTDFIFTILAEEFGIVGGLFLLLCYGSLIIYGIGIAARSRSQFGRLLCMGIVVNFFLYVFINMAMVMGLIPVVGVPLPMVSYGGTAMLALMFGFGLIMSVYVHRNAQISRHEASEFL